MVFSHRFIYTENVEPSAQNWWSLKAGGLSWQWSLKIGFTVKEGIEYANLVSRWKTKI